MKNILVVFKINYCIRMLSSAIKFYFFFIFLLLFNNQALLGQNGDSLSKYSYFLFAPTDEKGINDFGIFQKKSKIATVFFIRKEKRLFLVSAAHSILGLTYSNKCEAGFPDTFYLRLIKNNSTHFYDLKFSVKRIRQSAGVNFYQKNYDIIFYQMKLANFDIHSIEKFIIESDFDDKSEIKEGVFYGFAAKDGGDLSKGTINFNSFKQVTLTDKEKLYHMYSMRSGNSTYGYSGSPLFLITNKSKVKFGGVAVAGNGNYITFVPPSIIRNILKKL